MPGMLEGTDAERIAFEGWGFRSKPITDSGRNRSLNPVQTDH